MAIPKQVREAGERADQLIGEITKPVASDEPKPDETPTEVTEEAAPAAPPAETFAETTEDDPPAKQDRTDWKSKYHVLQGKYNAEVPRMHADLKAMAEREIDLKQQVAGLQQQVAELRLAAESAPKGPNEVDEAINTLREEYGDGIVKTIEQIAARRVEEAVKPLQGKVEQTEAERQARAASEERAQKARDFADAVNDLVPDWEQVDALPAFQAYLAEVGSDGKSRQDHLMAAAANFDAASAARIFATFKRSPGYQQQTPKPQAKTPPLASQLTPDASGRDRATPTGKIWTRQEITDFYRDVAQGKFQKTPERATEIERDIEAARGENRIR